MVTRRIGLLGSKGWRDRSAVEVGLTKVASSFPTHERVQLVHGGDHSGACNYAEAIWHDWERHYPFLYVPSEMHPIARFQNSERLRDDFIVRQNVDVVVTFFVESSVKDVYGNLSTAWKVPAVNARKMGIEVIDFGESTD